MNGQFNPEQTAIAEVLTDPIPLKIQFPFS